MRWAPPGEWAPAVWALYGVGVVYVAAVIAYYLQFRRAEARVAAGEPDAVARFNRLVTGFPNAFFAKMFGRRRLQ